MDYLSEQIKKYEIDFFWLIGRIWNSNLNSTIHFDIIIYFEGRFYLELIENKMAAIGS